MIFMEDGGVSIPAAGIWVGIAGILSAIGIPQIMKYLAERRQFQIDKLREEQKRLQLENENLKKKLQIQHLHLVTQAKGQEKYIDLLEIISSGETVPSSDVQKVIEKMREGMQIQIPDFSE